MAGARELKKPESKRKGPVLAAAAVLVVAGAYLGLCAWVGGTGEMPNVTVAGLDVSGKDLLEIQPVVDQALQEHGGNAKVTLTYGGWSGSITGDQMDPFGENSALNAWEVGRGSFLTRGVQYVRHLMGGTTEAEPDRCLEETEQPALEQLLDQYHDDGKEPNPMAKSMSWVKTNVKLAMNESDATIADLMTDGCNMGVKAHHKYLNQYKAADETS